jgi:hypothetical protein
VTDDVTLGGMPLREPSAANMRLAMLLWGDAGCGKTTLAATAPGVKLFVLLDPDGTMSIANRSDVRVLDLSNEPAARVIEKFRAPDPFGIEAYLKQHPEVETVVWDSVTAYAYMALQEAVTKNKSSSMEQPGMHGYQWRNASVIRATSALLAMTGRLNRNVIFTTHEAAPDRDEAGNLVSITMALSESTANQVGLRINEIWHMSDDGKKHVIAVRPCRQRKPMKTRLWNATKPEFEWRYDAVAQQGDGIAEWLATWRQAGGNKIPLPNGKR